MSKRIIRINASALKNSYCFLKFWRICIEGYKSRCNFSDIEFGSAFHVFTYEMARTNGDLPKSIYEARKYWEETPMLPHPKKKYLDLNKLMAVCTQYWIWKQREDKFEILNTESGPAVEVTFSNKFYEDDNYIVLLEGTIDKIGKFGQNGCYGIGDYKTTSSYEPEEYFKSHELGVQLRFYLFNLFLKARLEPDSFVAEICKSQVGAFIDGVFVTSKDILFKRSRIYFTKDLNLEQFEAMLYLFVKRVVEQLDKGFAPAPEGILNGACGGGFKLCQFYAVEAAPDDIARRHILRNEYKQEEYLPIKMKE